MRINRSLNILLTVFAAAVAVVFLPSCGWNQDTKAETENGRITVEINEYRLTPNKILARPGPVEVKVVNRGELAHNLIIMQAGRLVARTPTFQRGSRVIKASLRTGTYRMSSNIGKDRDLGVRGTISVK